jgi:hypothetical protein
VRSTPARSSTAKPDSSNYYGSLHGPMAVPQGCAALPGCASCLPSSDLTSALYAKLVNPRDPSTSLSGTPTPSAGYYGFTSLACTACVGPAWRMYSGQCGELLGSGGSGFGFRVWELLLGSGGLGFIFMVCKLLLGLGGLGCVLWELLLG